MLPHGSRTVPMSTVDAESYEASRLRAVASAHLQRMRLHQPKDTSTSESGAGTDEESEEYRDCLPFTMVNRKEISFWSILKSCIGKDLTKMVFPVILNEPISMVQRLCEYMEYAHLLEQAGKADNPVDRMEYIAGFVTSALSSNWMRAGKPFNALLGETFEITRSDLGFSFVGEQVSHHPPVTAIHAEGKGYSFHGSIGPRLSFWGKSIDVTPKGTLVVELSKYNEAYSWQNVHCYVHNIIIGELWMELHGQVTVTCNKSEVRAVLNFKESGWSHKDLHFVEGQVFNGKKLERMVYGSWVTGMFGCSPLSYEQFQKDTHSKARILNELRQEADQELDINAGLPVLHYNFHIPGQRVLWQANFRPSHCRNYYNFSLFTMTLNQMPKGARKTLPPTDSRFRPDQRLFETGKIAEAENEKVRIEMQQRQRRADNMEVKPLWFSWQRQAATGKEDWLFDESYWKRDWSKCPNIF